MCAAKSPISALQEHAMAKGTVFPTYELKPYGSGFKCVATMGEIRAETIAQSKKQAKHDCAELVLDQIQSQGDGTRVVSLNDNVSQVQVCTQNGVKQLLIGSEELKFNAVGRLNEACSQNRQPYPQYADVGIREHKVVMQCQLLSHTTEGVAATKKQAKQNAAKEMLSRLQSDSSQNKRIKIYNLEPVNDLSSEMDNKVIELCQRLSIARSSTARYMPTDDQESSFAKNGEVQNIGTEEIKQPETVKSNQELKQELCEIGVPYRIWNLQRHPLVLVLQTTATQNHPKYTFIHSDDGYNTTLNELLKISIHGIKLIFDK